MQLCRAQAVSDTPHIIIIGAGLIGLCTADALASRGARVTVLDARSGPCEGTSYSNSGMIHPSQACSWDPNARKTPEALNAARVSVELGQRSRDLLLKQMKQLGLPDRAAGCFQIQPDIDTARAMQTSQNDLGVRTDVVMDANLSFGHPACFFPDDASGDAQAFGSALAANLAARGVAFHYGETDLGLRQSDETISVKTSMGVLSAHHLVVAAGTGSPDVLEKLGVRLTLDPVSGAAADFALPENIENLPACPVMDAQSRSALTLFPDRLRVSGGWGVIDPAQLIARWTEIAPDLFSQLGDPFRTWTSKRPVSPAARPYISGTSVARLWVNAGHGHMGWTLCAGSGELMAQMILENLDDRRFAFAG